MKKIFSILICLVLGISSAWADAVSGTATSVLCKGGTCTEKTGGWVEVNTSSSNSTWNKYTDTDSDATSGFTKWTANIYMHQKAFDGNYFVGWASAYTANGTYSLIDSYQDRFSENHTATSTYLRYCADKLGTDGENIQRYAIFKPVTVDAVSPTSTTINSTDKLGYKETAITFTVAGADNMNDFVSDKVVLSGDSRFTIQSSTLSGNTVTVVVRFTDDDRHILDGTLPQATVTLTSKGDNSSAKTATITATSDLIPKFVVTPSPYNFTPNGPMEMGETKSQTFSISAATGYTNVVAAATGWTVAFEDAEDAVAKGYILDATDPKNPTVTFSPTIEYLNKVDIVARLCFSATYTDAADTALTYQECVTLTADAGKIIAINEKENAVMDFGIIDYTEVSVPVTQTFSIFSTLPASSFNQTVPTAFPAGITYDITFVGSTSATDQVTVTVQSTMEPAEYNRSILYTENTQGEDDPISASLTVQASIKLAKPVVTPTVLGNSIKLSWGKVYGAKRYLLKSGDVLLDTFTAGQDTYEHTVSQIGGVNLADLTQYAFTVTAMYDAENEHFGDRISDEVFATTGIPGKINPGDAIDMYTGTNKVGEYPYYPTGKTQIKLNDIFKDGEPLFDRLYIFGVTTNTEGGNDLLLPNDSVPCNAKTPCYVYVKNGNKYEFSTEFDATRTRFDHGNSLNDKKLYFTGYCPFAYMGGMDNASKTAEGWMYFTGGKGKRVDIYLSDCEIRGRFKTPTGKNAEYIPYELPLSASGEDILGGKSCDNFLSGCSSIFAFSSTSTESNNPYTPYIHISGTNHLKGQLGTYLTTCKASVMLGPIEITTIDVTQVRNVSTYSAPISVVAKDLSYYTHLVMDDVWPDNTIKNGYLRLDSEKGANPSEKTPSIDLGSANGWLTINGGQYHLRNAAADGQYACNLAIGYRCFSKEVEYSGIKGTIKLYGFGGDMTDSKVTINSGTFTMYANMYPLSTDEFGNPTAYMGDNYYRDPNFMDLRLPAGNGASRIYGGTFNEIENVSFCTKVTSTGASPIGAYDSWLCLQDVPVTDTTSNGSATFTIPSPFNSVYTDVTYNLQESPVVVGEDYQYGGQSANAFMKGEKPYVRLLLPGEACDGTCQNCTENKEAIIYQWVTAIPKFDASKDGQAIKMGGPTEVMLAEDGEDIIYETNQLMYMDLAGMEGYTLHLDGENADIRFNDPNMPRGHIDSYNDRDYVINKEQNFVKVVQADTWYTFTAPFDVNDVSVIETDETTIDVKDRQKSDALELQAKDNMRVLFELQNFIIPTAEGRASSMTLSVLLNMVMYNDGSYPDRPFNLTPINPLVHYDGTNIMTANYYLYELDPSRLNVNGEFSTNATGDALSIAWVPVKRNLGEPLMYKGKTYAIQFPWCPMCNDLSTRDYYDYWSNKMVIFHGIGSKTLDGKNKHASIVAKTTSAGTATLAGNSTFADMTLPAQKGYVHNTANDMFERNNADYTVKPGQGYLLFTPNTSKMPAAISRAGEMIYDSQDETGTDGLPTIGDRSSLMLFDAENGVEVLSLRDQWVAVYNTQGNLLYQGYIAEGQQEFIALPAGIYVIKGDKEAIKFLVD